MNKSEVSKPAQPPTSQKKQSSSLFSYLIFGLIGIWLYPHLFGNPSGEIEI